MTKKEKNILLGRLYAKKYLYHMTKNSSDKQLQANSYSYHDEYMTLELLAFALGVDTHEHTPEQQKELANKYYYEKAVL